MGFESLLGNERLKENLISSIAQGHLSHFYLISGPEGSGRHTLARLLAAAAVCGEANKPCLTCNHCRKVLANTHPDFITVEDPEKKTLPVRVVREAREDMFIRPNEADRKVYLFPQELNVEGQNALLKILEEPPSYGVFLLLTDNPEKLLPTVRSRSRLLRLQGLPETVLRAQLKKSFPNAEPEAVNAAVIRSGGYLGQAQKILEEGAALSPQTEQFVQAYASRDRLELLQLLLSLEKTKRDLFIPLLQQWLELLENGLVSRCGMQPMSGLAKQLSAGRSASELMDAVNQVKKCMEYAQGNVSVAACCGYLLWHLR